MKNDKIYKTCFFWYKNMAAVFFVENLFSLTLKHLLGFP